eukprot:6669664-Alexandrium_andersonii.AAC.1
MEEDIELVLHREDDVHGLLDLDVLGLQRAPAHLEVAPVAAGVQEEGPGIHERAEPGEVAWAELGLLCEVAPCPEHS